MNLQKITAETKKAIHDVEIGEQEKGEEEIGDREGGLVQELVEGEC